MAQKFHFVMSLIMEAKVNERRGIFDRQRVVASRLVL